MHGSKDSTAHSKPSNSLQHCIYTISMANIWPDRDAIPVYIYIYIPLSFVSQPDRISHRGRPVIGQCNSLNVASVFDIHPTLNYHRSDDIYLNHSHRGLLGRKGEDAVGLSDDIQFKYNRSIMRCILYNGSHTFTLVQYTSIYIMKSFYLKRSSQTKYPHCVYKNHMIILLHQHSGNIVTIIRMLFTSNNIGYHSLSLFIIEHVFVYTYTADSCVKTNNCTCFLEK